MKTISQIRQEGHELYNKSSHYVVGTFFSIMLITAIVQGVLNVIGAEFNFSILIVLGALVAPLELGMVRAVSLSYQRKAKEVKTKQFTWMGLKEYGSVFGPFVGKIIVVYLIQMITIGFFVAITTKSLSHLGLAMSTVITGNVNALKGTGGYIVPMGVLIGCISSLIIGFFVEAYFAFSYFIATERGFDLKDSLLYSMDLMKGNMVKYLTLKISYLPMMILSFIVTTICSMPLTTMFEQMIAIIPQVPIFVYNITLQVLVAFVSASASVMLYKVKEYFSIYCLFKDAEMHYVSDTEQSENEVEENTEE